MRVRIRVRVRLFSKKISECAAAGPLLVMALVAPSSASPAALPSEEACPVCASGDPAGDPAVASAREDLQRALQTGMALPDCIGPDHLEACREMESALIDAFTSLRKLVGEDPEAPENALAAGAGECLSCDPRAVVLPLLATVQALSKLLEGKQYEEMAPTLGKIENAMARWQQSHCCQTGNAPPAQRARDREADARAVLLQKCGPKFVDSRRGLRQVVRAPGEQQGCYQSRACRQATSMNGQLIEAGFWTYDGEYWYVWTERRAPNGEWTSCGK